MTDYKLAAKQLKEERAFLMKENKAIGQSMYALHTTAIKDGVISAKNKELIALGIAISTQCEGCMLAHIEGLISMGATLEEISETVDVAILMGGGPAVTYGGKAIAMYKALSA
ncbi:alkylhydroperoxidase [Wohlfahrtiimonas chitiniclastica]|uniref:Carboxymuconolactone decarboxylase-like domain-containing protein n=2 Tax=Wohlfahrtiimonas chitiniclastica TaxID=400946 RepID=L8Y206_9GAMM|nr:carboxymuconolactone decarboxylase family protein [Wohlfahrtiimonas chitiniclastica]ELV08481.1 Hypothetical protein F387_01077 [Wohlfahrtiimonas chitiniclastica SH04]KZX38144.1 alkylhydroperoxidase [Wohlfahrtiimonas chitiniclastica]MBS7818713.1 carboxymuconolactone decarboxylase family protein [Wohlfahrtiimonas chitiniclastica]MBS7821029.1 carboxymuconolactone decarboxylase family protein [Wohlfahrtiimonas chitiniclastica]MBS7823672.1 carboxymuconolactone decarboxylase family protein [Wohlf